MNTKLNRSNSSYVHGWTQRLPRYLLMALLLILALGALPGGYALFMQPDGAAMGWSVDWLAGSPFKTYLIPGIILFTLFGVGSLVTLLGLIAQPRWAAIEPLMRHVTSLLRPLELVAPLHWSIAAAALIGLGQMIWILVEAAAVRTFSWLQPMCFLLGLGILLLSWRVATKSPQPSK